MTMADRIAVMDAGEIVQVATPPEIYEAPNSRFVADFIGDVNMIEAKVIETSEDGTRLQAASADFVIQTTSETTARPGDTVWYAIRPEKVRLVAGDTSPSNINAAAAVVWDIAYLGDVSIFNARINETDVLRSTVTNATRLVERPITWDDRVILSWDQDAGVILTK